MTLHIFNPEHDMALADGRPNYTPPEIIRRMASDLASLPRLWADEGDAVWPDTPEGVSRIEPWGWDPRVAHILRAVPAYAPLVPDDQRLSVIRSLSSRHTAVRALSEFRESGLPSLTGESRWCTDLSALSYPCVIKEPWSSSGRGVIFATSPLTASQRARCERVIARSGGLAVETLCRRTRDFAFEYEGVEFAGISLFETSPTGAYSGNILAPIDEKMRRLGLTSRQVSALVSLHQAFIQREIAPHYTGPIGIDMMICEDGINPCVEINLRRTMGHVALSLESKGHTGRFIVGYDRQRASYFYDMCS